MAMIRCALDRTMSWQCNAPFPNVFGLIFTSLDEFEVARHVKTHQKPDIDLALIHVSFGQNEEISFVLCSNSFEVSYDVLMVTDRLLEM